ncbi:MAG: hypothetical protein LUI06_10705 [Ruminococcus sp.]|nr:hypothetical protein [Ruminococcus sp.]
MTYDNIIILHNKFECQQFSSNFHKKTRFSENFNILYKEGSFIMLNIFITILVLMSIVLSIIAGTSQSLSTAILEGANEAISLGLSLAASMALWGGIINVAERAGIVSFLTKLIKKPLRLLFDNINDEQVLSFISLNVSANLLGIGNAATPLGIKAMKELNKIDGCSGKNTAMFILLNTASIQLIPITVSGMRLSHGAQQPWDCTIPTIITSLAAFITGSIIINAIYSKIEHKIRRKVR